MTCGRCQGEGTGIIGVHDSMGHPTAPPGIIAMHAIDFHAHHSPLGAYATFTCGRFAAGGGFSIAGARPASQDLIIGVVEGDTVHALPFFRGAKTGTDNYVQGGDGSRAKRTTLADVTRVLGGGSDAWTAGDVSFAIHTPVVPLPDPEVAGDAALQEAVLPVLAATLTLDNRGGTTTRRLIFAVNAGQCCRFLTVGGAKAVGWGREFGFASPHQHGVTAFINFSELDFLTNGDSHLLGATCGLVLDVPAGTIGTLPLTLGFCRDGVVTTGVEGRFWYTRAYATIERVLAAGVMRYDALIERAAAMDAELVATGWDEHRRFLYAHSERSYWGNTQLIDVGGRPWWIVLEGEYAMINTFDLTVDMLFYEMRRNPWTVRNVLDQFVERYSYHDLLVRPGGPALKHEFTRDPHRLHDIVPKPAATGLPGGISFCHDMGVASQFSPPAHSSYECPGLAGCFSYMTCEQLYNWICTATTYVLGSGDDAWLRSRAPIVAACLESLLNRDDPEPARRTGLNQLDSDRCAGGWEITTYDSLDASLGQARNNLYMATKGWAAALGLAHLLRRLGDGPREAQALSAATRAAAAIVARFNAQLGYIPAVFEAGNTSAIIPAIEGLVFPLVWNDSNALDRNGPFAELLTTLERHLHGVLQPGRCLFPDGGWKLSSTSDNSWISKVFICQHVAERVFGVVPALESHAAHARWQQIGESADWAMCDQCIAGQGKASKYYPRCVTADLWLTPA